MHCCFVLLAVLLQGSAVTRVAQNDASVTVLMAGTANGRARWIDVERGLLKADVYCRPLGKSQVSVLCVSLYICHFPALGLHFTGMLFCPLCHCQHVLLLFPCCIPGSILFCADLSCSKILVGFAESDERLVSDAGWWWCVSFRCLQQSSGSRTDFRPCCCSR